MDTENATCIKFLKKQYEMDYTSTCVGGLCSCVKGNGKCLRVNQKVAGSYPLFHWIIQQNRVHKKGVYYQGIKIYNLLPKTIKDLSGDKNKFKLALKNICYITPSTV